MNHLSAQLIDLKNYHILFSKAKHVGIILITQKSNNSHRGSI